VQKSVQLNAPGARVDIEAALPTGYVTIVDFWSESCAACKVVGAKLEAGVASESRIVIRKVDVGDGLTDVAKDYDIGALPAYRIYDKRGRLRYLLVGNDCLEAPRIARALAAAD
jgi:thiol-disulfide isomerase/thioredoxin